MKRREFLQVSALASVHLALGNGVAVARENERLPKVGSRNKGFEFEEATFGDLQSAMRSGKETAVSICNKYLDRIDDLDRRGPSVNSVIELNPDALAIARALDRERKERGPRGPLHGIPVLIKDNIDTRDRMKTTAGSLAMLDAKPLRDSFVAQKLRDAGAIILGKTNLSEWANFRGDRSTSGWSGRGGQTNNPYSLDRNPSGSSSGSAAAVTANFCAGAIGTETDGSIVSPSALCGLVGIKPTIGLVSRGGIIPIGHSQDTAGPMTRTVADAAMLLGALAGYDSRDNATEAIRGKSPTDYMQFLDPGGLRGARIGVARKFFRSGPAEKLIEAAMDEMQRQGATVIDPIDDPALTRFGDAERTVLFYEFKHDLNAYLASLGDGAPVRSLKEIIEFNERNKDKELLYFGQETMLKAEEKGPLTEKEYLDAVAKCRRLSRDEGIDAAMQKHQLDAIIAPAGGPAAKTDHVNGDRGIGGSSSPAAVAGYPNITVPAGFVFGLPVGISFFGRAFSEPKLIKLAYAFEQATRCRKPPRLLTTVA